jgi:hypothetical protein
MSRKTLNIITITVFVISIIVGLFTFFNTTKIKDGDMGSLNPLFYWTFILLAVAVVLVFLLPLPGIIKNPKALKTTLFAIVAIVVAFGVVYLLSTKSPEGEQIIGTLKPLQKDAYLGSSVVANMNIIGAEIALALGVLAILWSAVRDLLVKK